MASLAQSGRRHPSGRPPNMTNGEAKSRFGPAQLPEHAQPQHYFDDATFHNASAKDPLAMASGQGTAMQSWLHDKNEPWKLRDSIPTDPTDYLNQSQAFLAHAYSTHQNHNFMDYRGGDVLSMTSECETAPADSGYGSRQTHSRRSVPSQYGGDDLMMDSTLMGPLDNFNIQTLPGTSLDQAPESVQAAGSTENKPYCTVCKKDVKTQSELNKHINRHQKPFRCENTECMSSGKGFSSKNDLLRHLKSVHRAFADDDVAYVCRHEPCIGRVPPKRWPRLDNFRCHLRRVHNIETRPDGDFKSYIQSSVTQSHELEGVGTSVSCINPGPSSISLHDPSENLTEVNLLSPIVNDEPMSTIDGRLVMGAGPNPSSVDHSDNVMSTKGNTQNAEDAATPVPPFVQPGDLVFQHFGDGRALTDLPQVKSSQLNLNEAEEVQHDDAMDVDEEGTPTSPTLEDPHQVSEDTSSEEDDSLADLPNDEVKENLSNEISTSPSDRLEQMLSDLVGGGKKNEQNLLRALQCIPKEYLASVLRAGTSESIGTNSSEPTLEPAPGKGMLCDKCDKFFSRPCELRKHMKRHEKPYGCTYHKCKKSFGSKNDWKRHESTQHSQLETYNCREPECDKVCCRRESFKTHMKEYHGKKNEQELEDVIDKSRIGRHCDPKFWCGFCVEVVQIDIKGKQGPVNMWTKRCDHIDSHLFGKDGLPKKNRDDWQHIEDLKAEREHSETSSSAGESEGTSKSVASSDSRPTSGAEDISKKRGQSQDDSSRPRKRPHHGQTNDLLWACCICKQEWMIKIYSTCVECGHPRCTRDEVFLAQARDQAAQDEDQEDVFAVDSGMQQMQDDPAEHDS